MVKRRIQQSHASLYVYLPSTICKDNEWEKGDELVFFTLRRNLVLITKLEGGIPEELRRILELYEFKPMIEKK